MEDRMNVIVNETQNLSTKTTKEHDAVPLDDNPMNNIKSKRMPTKLEYSNKQSEDFKEK